MQFCTHGNYILKFLCEVTKIITLLRKVWEDKVVTKFMITSRGWPYSRLLMKLKRALVTPYEVTHWLNGRLLWRSQLIWRQPVAGEQDKRLEICLCVIWDVHLSCHFKIMWILSFLIVNYCLPYHVSTCLVREASRVTFWQCKCLACRSHLTFEFILSNYTNLDWTH